MIDQNGIEAHVDDCGHAVDDTAQQDRQPPDVEERQAGQPAVVGVQAKVQRRGDRAPPVIAAGQDGALGPAGRAGGVDDAVRLGEIEVAPG